MSLTLTPGVLGYEEGEEKMKAYGHVDDLATEASKVGGKHMTHQSMVARLATEDLSSDERRLLLAHLYKKFMPSKPRRPQTVERWLNMAVAGADRMDCMQYVYSDGQSRVATDGHRLHLELFTQLNPGYYDKAGNRVELNQRYVDYRRVIPDKKGRARYELSEIKIRVRVYRRHHYVVLGPHGITLDKKYWDEALSFMSENPTVYLATRSDSALIEDHDKIAVIMPVRL